MRMFLLFILLLLPINVSATNCNIFTNSQDIDGCISAEGCEWKGTACGSCSENTYCPQGGGGCTNGSCACADNAVKSNFDPVAHQICGSDANCPSHPMELVFDRSFAGAASIDECYVQLDCTDYSTVSVTVHHDCRLTYGDAANNPTSPECSGTLSTDYFIKTVHTDNGNQLICESNESLCSHFSSVGCDGGEITGTAIINNNNYDPWYLWYISDCKCEKTNAGIDTQWQSDSYKCIGTETFTNPTSVVESHHDEISWTPDNSTYNYYCTGCPAGYYLETSTNYNWVQTNQNSLGKCINPNNTPKNFVCGCTQVQKGYYKENACSWTYPLNAAPDCDQTPCATGQTTNQAGSTSAGACHYTAATRFVDAGGEFTLDNPALTDFAPETWQLLP